MIKSFIEILIEDLDEFEDLLSSFIDSLSFEKHIQKTNPFSSFSERPQEIKYKIVVSPLDDRQSEKLYEIKDLTNGIRTRFNHLFRNKSREKQFTKNNIIKSLSDFVQGKYQFINNKDLEKKKMKDQILILRGYIEELEFKKENNFILVPDTNALIYCYDIAKYEKLIDNKVFRLIVTPTVISELDKIKNEHSNKELTNKVKKIIRIFKGWRKQGNILEGITIENTIDVQFIAKEPNMGDMPTWMDAENHDDRIVASIIEIQRNYPTSKVILITRDMNMLNKATLAKIPYIDPEIIFKLENETP